MTARAGRGAVYLPTAAEIVITEGEKKALCATQHGFATIGLVGVSGWKPKGRAALLPALERIPWKGRPVYIGYDSDGTEKPDVQAAESQFAALLSSRDAIVKVVRLPPGPAGEKVGIDDYLVAHGPAALRKMMDQAEEPTPPDPAEMKIDGKDLDPAVAARDIVDARKIDGLSQVRFYRGGFLAWQEGAYREVQTSEVRARTINILNNTFRNLSGRTVSDVVDQLRAQTLLDGENDPIRLAGSSTGLEARMTRS